MKLKKTVFIKAAKKVTKNEEFACMALRASIPKNCGWSIQYEYFHHFTNLYGPLRDSNKSWWGDRIPKNQLARSLALLLAAEMVNSK